MEPLWYLVQLNPTGMTCYFVAVSEQDMCDIAANPNLLLTLTLEGEAKLSAEEMELLGITDKGSEWEPAVEPKILYVDKARDVMKKSNRLKTLHVAKAVGE